MDSVWLGHLGLHISQKMVWKRPKYGFLEGSHPNYTRILSQSSHWYNTGTLVGKNWGVRIFFDFAFLLVQSASPGWKVPTTAGGGLSTLGNDSDSIYLMSETEMSLMPNAPGDPPSWAPGKHVRVQVQGSGPPVNQFEWSLVTQSSWYYTTPPIGSHTV